MALKTLTGANSIISLGVAGLFSVPQQLQQFAADDVFDTAQVQRAIVEMGVDGFLSSGFIYRTREMTIALQANSPSVALFTAWEQAEEAAGDTLPGSLIVILPSLQIKFAMAPCYFTDGPPGGALPSVKAIASPLRYRLQFPSPTAAPT